LIPAKVNQLGGAEAITLSSSARRARLLTSGHLLPSSWNRFGQSELNDGQRASRSAAMHLHTYRDESRSGHLDLIGGRGHPWSIDLVAVTASGILLMGFACAVAALLVH